MADIPSAPSSHSPPPSGPIQPISEEPIPIIKIALIGMLFAVGCFYAAKFGTQLAKMDVPGQGETLAPLPAGTEATLGKDGKAIYVADTTERLRQFYLAHPDESSRTETDLANTGVRRLYGRVEVRTLRSLTDAVQVRVTSGSIAGAIYWIHRDQLPGDSAANTILSPIPQ